MGGRNGKKENNQKTDKEKTKQKKIDLDQKAQLIISLGKIRFIHGRGRTKSLFKKAEIMKMLKHLRDCKSS